MDIEDSKYAELVAEAEKAKRLPEVEKAASDAEEARKAAEKTAEEAEAAKVKAEEERDEEKKQREKAELRDERFDKLGTGFRAKLDKLETTKKVVERQAAELSDEAWEERVAELEETLGTKRDAKADNGDPDPEEEATAGGFFDKEVVARSAVGDGGNNGSEPEVTEPSSAARDNVIGGLFGRKPAKPEAKA